MAKKPFPAAVLPAPRAERLSSYLQNRPSPDDIVKSVTTAFAGDVARIMATKGDGGRAAQGGERKRRPPR